MSKEIDGEEIEMVHRNSDCLIPQPTHTPTANFSPFMIMSALSIHSVNFFNIN